MRRNQLFSLLLAMLLLTLLVAGCSSDADDEGADGDSTDTAAAEETTTEAAGSDEQAADDAPTEEGGDTATEDPDTGSDDQPLAGMNVWYLDITDANPLVVAVAQAMYRPIKEAGGEMTRTFAINPTSGQLDLALQAESFTRALSSGADAVAYFLIDPASLRPQVEQAQEMGVPVFAAFGEPDGFDVNAYILLADYEQGYLSAQYLAENLPDGAEVAVIGGPPTANVNAELEGAMAALEDSGVSIVGDVENQRNLQDNAAGGQEIMQGILQSFPDVQGVFAYNDDSALGAIAAAKQADRDIVFTSRNASADAIEAIRAGDLLATCDIDPIALGEAFGGAIVDQLSGAADYTNEQLPSPDASDCLVTPDNVDDFTPWNERIPFQDIPQG